VPRPNLARHLGEILDGLPDAIVVTNDCGTIVRVNSQVENLFGYKPDELVGISVEKLMAPRYWVAHARHRAAYFSHPTPRCMGTSMPPQGRRKDGSEFPASISRNPLQVGNRLFVVSAIRDISDWRYIGVQLHTVEEMVQKVIGMIGQAGYSAQRAVQISPGKFKSLSPREKEILRLLAEGKANKDVAAILGISVKTVETYRVRVLHKLNLDSLVGLVHYAIRHQIIQA